MVVNDVSALQTNNTYVNFVHPHQVLAELKKSNFMLLNESIQFDENGDPKFGSYSIIFWNQSGAVLEVGHYAFQPSVNFFINSTKIQWYTNDVSYFLYQQHMTGIC